MSKRTRIKSSKSVRVHYRKSTNGIKSLTIINKSDLAKENLAKLFS